VAARVSVLLVAAYEIPLTHRKPRRNTGVVFSTHQFPAPSFQRPAERRSRETGSL